MDNHSLDPHSQPSPRTPRPAEPAPQPQHYQPAPPPTYVTTAPANNQGSIGALILSLVALTAVVIFFLMKYNGSTAEAADPELERLRTQKRITSELSSPVDTSTGLAAANLADQISQDAEGLAGLITDVTDRLAAKDSLIAQQNTDLDNAAKARESLHADIAALNRQIEELRLNSSNSSSIKLQLDETRKLYEAAQSEIARLRERLSGAPSSDALLSLRQENERLQQALRTRPDESILAELRATNKRLRIELQQYRAESSRNRLFAESADGLSPDAQAVFNKLLTLEGASTEERLRAYKNINDEMNSRVIEKVTFSTGSSSVDLEKVNVVQNSLKSTSPQAEYLIVGYASKSGDAASNQELSSKRATTVATIVDVDRGANQTVKAVYLGQTDRFSKTNDFSNQICEVWEVLPR